MTADAYEVVESNWPYDGPYSHTATTKATLAIGQLVRYLNNATGKKPALPYAATSYHVLTGISSAVHGLDQLVRQLADVAETQVGDPTLYDDRGTHDTAGSMADETTRRLAAQLLDATRPLADLANRLQQAASTASHLGNR